MLSEKLARGMVRHYPWGQWTNGEEWEAHHPKDFTVGMESLRSQLRKKAHKLGMKVMVRMDDRRGVVWFKFSHR